MESKRLSANLKTLNKPGTNTKIKYLKDVLKVVFMKNDFNKSSLYLSDEVLT
jgi:hypothetical protein